MHRSSKRIGLRCSLREFIKPLKINEKFNLLVNQACHHGQVAHRLQMGSMPFTMFH